VSPRPRKARTQSALNLEVFNVLLVGPFDDAQLERVGGADRLLSAYERLRSRALADWLDEGGMPWWAATTELEEDVVIRRKAERVWRTSPMNRDPRQSCER
jgi:hypothetical protein